MKLLAILLMCIFTPVIGYTQWIKVVDVPSLISSIYIIDNEKSPSTIILGLGNTFSGGLFSSFDGGQTWTQDNTFVNNVTDIVFKDTLVGWLSLRTDISDAKSCCYKTIDGGKSWFPVGPADRDGLAISYNKANGRLFVSSWRGQDLYSDDEGVSWINWSSAGGNGFTFSKNGQYGVVTHVTPIVYTKHTSDGGITWLNSNLTVESYQPCNIGNTFFIASEIDEKIYRSDDFGANWLPVFSFNFGEEITGCIRTTKCSTLVIQSADVSSPGFRISSDSGKSWTNMGGPRNFGDTRFLIHGGKIYAGKFIFGQQSELWVYSFDGIEPVVQPTKLLAQTSTCNSIDTIISITIPRICYLDSFTINSVLLSGSQEFSVSSPTSFPLKLSGYDSLGVRYTPTDSGDDTTYLTINFYRDGDRFDTIITLIGHADIGKGNLLFSFTPDTVYSNLITCSNDSEVIHFRVQDTCRNLFATATRGNISGSSAFVLPSQLPKLSTGDDSLVVTFFPLRFGLDTSMLHVTFELDGVNVDTTFVLIGEYRPSKLSLTPTVSDTSLSVTSSNCIGANGHIYYSVFDSCLGTKGVLLSASVTGSTNFQVTADADSATVIYNGAGYDTAKLALKFRLYEYEYDTVITLYGYPSATKDSLTFLATLTKPSVTWEETTELRVTPDKAAANKNLSEIRFDVTLDADVLEPLTNYSTGIAGAAIMMGSPTPVGKLMRFPFTITGNNMTLDPAVIILNMPMRPYVSDTTMTTIEVSTIRLNPQDADYERCTLSATGNGTPFSLELMCGDSTLSRYLGGKPILTITSLKPNPTKADVTVTFDLATSGSVQAEVLDVLGNVVKEETLEATQGETKYNISLPDAPEGVYYVRLRFAGETRTGKFVRE